MATSYEVMCAAYDTMHAQGVSFENAFKKKEELSDETTSLIINWLMSYDAFYKEQKPEKYQSLTDRISQLNPNLEKKCEEGIAFPVNGVGTAHQAIYLPEFYFEKPDALHNENLKPFARRVCLQTQKFDKILSNKAQCTQEGALTALDQLSQDCRKYLEAYRIYSLRVISDKHLDEMKESNKIIATITKMVQEFRKLSSDIKVKVPIHDDINFEEDIARIYKTLVYLRNKFPQFLVKTLEGYNYTAIFYVDLYQYAMNEFQGLPSNEKIPKEITKLYRGYLYEIEELNKRLNG